MEYKVGNRAKAAWIAACDDLQLAAQALCLEIVTGAIDFMFVDLFGDQ